jgi:pyruvate dehydrogenase E2 component (dihydrolipoamide acetyltransferase)
VATETTNVVDFTLPSLGSDMEEGTVLTWLVAPGDHVNKGDVLLRVDTEKAEIDVEVWHEAVVLELLVQRGETVPVGTTLARLESGAAPATDEPPTAVAPLTDEPPAAIAPPTAVAPQIVAVPPAASSRESASVEATEVEPRPKVPVVAEGPKVGSTAVTHATPRMVYWPAAHLQQPVSTAPVRQAGRSATDDTRSRADRRQSAVAALMERSNSEIPHFHLVRQVDLTVSLAWLERRNNAVPPGNRILPAALLLYAVARAAANSPINGTFDGESIDADQVDLGVAVHVRGGGLMTPVLPAADAMALDTLMGELQVMVGRARSGRLNSRDMTSATLTVTNLGDSGADVVLGVIRPPERALVGFGQIAERPVVLDGELAARPTVQVTLSADHRVVNGQAGARFLDALETVLSQPDNITLVGAST